MLTARQRELLLYIARYIEKNGVSPSIDEMRAVLGLQSKNSAYLLVVALEERGYVRRHAGRKRNVEVLRLPQDPLHVHESERSAAPQADCIAAQDAYQRGVEDALKAMREHCSCAQQSEPGSEDAA